MKNVRVLFVLILLPLIFGFATSSTALAGPDAGSAMLAQPPELQVFPLALLADACTDSCDQALADDIAFCDANFNPDTMCGGEPECIAVITNLHDACIADANTAYATCTEGCAAPPVSCSDCVGNLAAAVEACQVTYDPELCGGDPACEIDVITGGAECMNDAVTAYNTCAGSCEASPPSCTTSCEQSHADAISSCIAGFDPVAVCSGDVACMAEVYPQLNGCLADAEAAFDACTGACATPDEQTITIVKDARPDGEQDFKFSGSTGIGAFPLDDDGDNSNDLSNQRTFRLEPGSYRVSEVVPSGWTLTDLTCTTTDDAEPVDVTDGIATINLDEGEDVTCTFTNGINNSSLTIVKRANPNDGTDFTFTAEGPSLPPSKFTLDDEPGQPNDGVEQSITFNNLAPGNYTIREQLAKGWVLEDVTCPGAKFSFDPKSSGIVVDIRAGADIICTFTNVNKGGGVGTITIIKDAKPDDAQDFEFTLGGNTTGSFSLDDDGNNGNDLSNQVTLTLKSGVYSLIEQLPGGWSLDGIVCEGGKVQPKGAGIEFEVVAGSEITCTFTNSKSSIITVAADNASVVVNEGQTAANNGTVSDSDGDPVTLTASIGSVINNNDDTWSWTFGTSDGPDQTQTVTITADDANGSTAQTTFGLTVNNLAPTASLGNDGPIAEGGSATVSFSGASDPSSDDTTAGFHYAFDCNGGSLSTAAYASSGTSDSTSCSFAMNGIYTVSGKIMDKDDGSNEYTTTVLVYAFAPGGGAFVIGDQTATGSVTFWGSQWAKLNVLSGGSAPSAFKGFALFPTTPACGVNWSTDPGNSTPPPAGPLPAYMAVIVTSSSSKSGSTISGNTVGMVVVQTNPGYSSNPGHPGTGTVVATICP